MPAIEVPLICGAMYPCSNPELVAAVSEAGGIGIVQPISLTYVHGHDFREGLRLIRRLTAKPIGMNALIEESSQALPRADGATGSTIALEEGVRFFVTSLGNPRWVVRAGARRRAASSTTTSPSGSGRRRGCDAGVDGLIAVNARAGGHAGPQSAEALLDELGRPRAAGRLRRRRRRRARTSSRRCGIGYAGVQMGTRFIATPECRASDGYKQAIVDADEDDIVLTERITGVPGRGDQHALRPAHRHQGRPAGALDAARPAHQALDAHVLRAASLWQLKRASLDETGVEGLLAGGQERRGDRRGSSRPGEIVRRCKAVAGSR